jgi:hypothetical protein
MRKAVVTITLLACLCAVYASAQSIDTRDLVITVEADSAEMLFLARGAASAKQNPEDFPFEYRGNVVILINDLRITARSAVWHQQVNRIDLNDGSAQVQLPQQPKTTKISIRRSVGR